MGEIKVLGRGSNAVAYLKEGETIKKYYKNTDAQDRLSREMFELLKSINEEHFMKLKKYKLGKVIDEELEKKVVGIKEYTYQYVKNYDVDRIEDLQDYLFTNFYSIEKLADRFTKQGIMLCDTSSYNSVFTKDKIVLIDPDYFTFSEHEVRTYRHNKIETLHLFIDILSDYYVINYNKRNALYNDITEDITGDLYKKIKLLKIERKK